MHDVDLEALERSDDRAAGRLPRSRAGLVVEDRRERSRGHERAAHRGALEPDDDRAMSTLDEGTVELRQHDLCAADLVGADRPERVRYREHGDHASTAIPDTTRA